MREATIDRQRRDIEERYAAIELGSGTIGGTFGEILCHELHQGDDPRPAGLHFGRLASKWNVSLHELGLLIADHCDKLEGIKSEGAMRMETNYDERFERWLTGELVDIPMERKHLSTHALGWARAAFTASAEIVRTAERARVRELCDRIEALTTYRIEIDDDGPHIARSADGFYVNTEELLTLVEELRQ